MPIIISDNGHFDRYNVDRLTAIRNLITVFLEISGEVLAETATTELQKERQKYLAALQYHISQETDKLVPRASEAEKTDALKKLFGLE